MSVAKFVGLGIGEGVVCGWIALRHGQKLIVSAVEFEDVVCVGYGVVNLIASVV